MHKELKVIREQMGYSVRGFAELLGFEKKHSTYQHYESNRRKCPPQVIEEARAAYKRDQRFFGTELPGRIDAVPMFMGEARP